MDRKAKPYLMTEKSQSNPASRIIRERAMKVLRETRAKIDPQLLEAMKERLSAMVPDTLAAPNTDAQATRPVSPSPLAEAARHNAPRNVPAASTKTPEPAYPHQSFATAEDHSEPVDRQKIAKIVMEYMKNRDDGQRH